MKNNFIEMASLLKVLTIIGLLAPVLSIFSIYTGSIDSIYKSSDSNQSPPNVIEAIVFFLCAVPIFIASCLMLYKKVISRYSYIFGGVIVCLSPLSLQAVRNNTDVFVIELSFYLVIIFFIWVYLFKNENVISYMTNKTVNN